MKDTEEEKQPDKASAEMQKELEAVRNQMLRIQADFENAQKRWLKAQAESQEVANEAILRQLLEIFDDFERALKADASGANGQTFRAGVEMIARRMEEFLKSYGVVPMDPVGNLFDPTQHEAIAHEATDSAPEATVLAELRKGYLMNGRGLRPSTVKVAVKKEV